MTRLVDHLDEYVRSVKEPQLPERSVLDFVMIVGGVVLGPVCVVLGMVVSDLPLGWRAALLALGVGLVARAGALVLARRAPVDAASDARIQKWLGLSNALVGPAFLFMILSPFLSLLLR